MLMLPPKCIACIKESSDSFVLTDCLLSLLTHSSGKVGFAYFMSMRLTSPVERIAINIYGIYLYTSICTRRVLEVRFNTVKPKLGRINEMNCRENDKRFRHINTFFPTIKYTLEKRGYQRFFRSINIDYSYAVAFSISS